MIRIRAFKPFDRKFVSFTKLLNKKTIFSIRQYAKASVSSNDTVKDIDPAELVLLTTQLIK